jgi:hypothetical protein
MLLPQRLEVLAYSSDLSTPRHTRLLVPRRARIESSPGPISPAPSHHPKNLLNAPVINHEVLFRVIKQTLVAPSLLHVRNTGGALRLPHLALGVVLLDDAGDERRRIRVVRERSLVGSERANGCRDRKVESLAETCAGSAGMPETAGGRGRNGSGWTLVLVRVVFRRMSASSVGATGERGGPTGSGAEREHGWL